MERTAYIEARTASTDRKWERVHSNQTVDCWLCHLDSKTILYYIIHASLNIPSWISDVLCADFNILIQSLFSNSISNQKQTYVEYL